MPDGISFKSLIGMLPAGQERETGEIMEQDMTQGKPLSIILKFTLPLIIGNIFQQFYNMADTIIVGRFVGAGALAAVGSTGTVMFLLTGLSQGLTAGFSVLTSQRYGAGDEEHVRRSVANGILLSLLAAVILTAFSVSIMRPLLGLMNTPADIFEDAYSYIIIISFGLVTNVFYNLFSAFMRSVGNSKVPLFFLVFSACVNIVLDLVFIINFHMGTAGAAVATNLSQGISAVLCLIYIYKKVPVLTPAARHWRLNGGDTKHQLTMGIPMALQFAITASGTMIMQSAINLFGSTAVAAFTAAGKVENLVTQGMMAMGQTMASYGGQNYGKGDYKRLKEGVRAAVLISCIYSVIAAVLVVLLLKPGLMLFFSGDVDINEMLPWAKTYIYMSVFFFVPLSMIFIFRNIMQGCGFGFLPMMGGVVELLARLITAVAAMHIVSYPLACFSDPMAWLSAGIFTGVAWLFVSRQIEKRLNPAGKEAS